MALDRTWYNTLVDDDGSGMTGSVWDKADVDSLMDAIDAEILRLEPVRIAWTPVVQNSAFVTLAVDDKHCAYHRVGKVVYYTIYLTGIHKSGATSTKLVIYTPNGLGPVNDAIERNACATYDNAVYAFGVLQPRTAGYIEAFPVYNNNLQSWSAVDGAYVIGQGFYYIA
jgi:hypothetical protein